MKTINKIFLFIFLLSPKLFSQIVDVSDTFKVDLKNQYKISSINIIPFSEKVSLSHKILERNYYSIDYKTGKFSLKQDLKFFLRDTIIIEYKSIQFNLKKEYQKRSLVIQLDEKNFDTLKISKPTTVITTESLFGKDLQKSGSLIRGFTIGTNRDFTLNSGLHLQLSGKLSDDINIVAALSDENIPIQPEGNTETLEELDKVFIEIRHENGAATFGDYDFNLSNSEFNQVSRKLQGLMGEFQYKNSKAKISVAASRGKFNSNSFLGQDGNQGPYRLYGINNERAIIIIASSEKVYLDGNLLKRGENNDYTIDYSNAEVTFTPKRLITSASRIIVEFEYSDQKFKRNFFGFDFSTAIIDNNLKFGISYLKDGDDENNPIDFSYTAVQKSILKNAGNDRNKAFISGVSVAGFDSLNNQRGFYFEKDTTINNQTKKIYVYAATNPNSIYNVTFSFVGFGKGDYEKESLGKYKFVGYGQGSYLPIIFIPMPEQKQLGNFTLEYRFNEKILLNGEISLSSFDPNKLSSIDDSKNIGYARKIFFEIKPSILKIDDNSFGEFGFSFKDRFLQAQYSSFDRIDNVEFNRDYNISSKSGDQVLREIQFNYLPVKNISTNAKYGFLKQGNNFTANRFSSQIDFTSPNFLATTYNIDFVSSTNSSIKSDWIKQNAKANFTFNKLSTGFDFLFENKKEKIINKDSLISSSLAYSEISPFINLINQTGINAKVSVSYRDESFPISGKMKLQSTSTSQRLELTYNGIRELNSYFNIALRNKKFTHDFKEQGFTNNNTILILTQNRVNLFNNFFTGDVYYQASTEQTARLEKVFVKVQKGSGNYIYLGDLNNDGIPEENEFQLSFYDADFIMITIPTEKLFPIIDLKTNYRLRLDFSKIKTNNDFINKILNEINTESTLRINEQSKDENISNIYLMRLSKFMNEQNTLLGNQTFLQDINILPNSNELSFRLRFNQRNNLSQYSTGSERGFYRERSLRIRFKMIEEISNQTDYINVIDNYLSPPTSNRSRLINSNSLISDFSYRPERNLEIGFRFDVSKSLDKYPAKPQTIDQNSILLRTNISFENLGRLRIEIERTELTSSSSNYLIPYEILKGNQIGKNYFVRIFFDYRLSNMIQTSLSYDMRKQSSYRLIHNLRAEARANF